MKIWNRNGQAFGYEHRNDVQLFGPALYDEIDNVILDLRFLLQRVRIEPHRRRLRIAIELLNRLNTILGRTNNA